MYGLVRHGVVGLCMAVGVRHVLVRPVKVRHGPSVQGMFRFGWFGKVRAARRVLARSGT